MEKDLNYYLSLNWTYTVKKDFDGNQPFYIIRVNELPGVCTDATNLDEGMRNIKDAIASAVQLYLEQGAEVAEPINC